MQEHLPAGALMSRSDFRKLAVPLIVGGVAITAAGLARRIYRDNQLFLPSPDPVKSWNPEDYGIPAGATEEFWIDTRDGQRLHAWYCRSAKPIASGLFCHGNKGNLTVSAPIIPHLLKAGLSILFFDYRGYGRSSGSPSIRGILTDALAAARAHDRLRAKKLPSILYGFSLGGAVAGQLINRHRFDGLILQSAFTSLMDMTRLMHPRLPMHLLAGKLFDTLSVVRKLKAPLLVLHGAEDEVAPAWMAHKLHDSCPHDSRSIHIIEGGLHRDIYECDGRTLRRAIRTFALSPAVRGALGERARPEHGDSHEQLERIRQGGLAEAAARRR